MGSSGINGRYMGILFLKACQERCSDLQLWLAAWPWLPLRPTPTMAPTATAWATPATAVMALEPSTLPRGLLILTMATATELDTATDTPAPSPPESPLSLTPDSPSRATLRATATATAMVTNHHICSSLTRL